MIKNLRKTRQRLVFNANGLVFTAVALQSTLEVDTANKAILKFDMSKWSNFDQNQDGNAILHHLNEIQTIVKRCGSRDSAARKPSVQT